MKRFSLLYLGALAGVLACLAPPASMADDRDKKTIVTISEPTEVPGTVLAPGTYVIKLLDTLSNRHIAEIMNEKMDHLYALTFTVPADRVRPTGKTVLTFYEGSNGRPPGLRRWFWPGDTNGQEFIYPKDQAARISAATKEKVPQGELPTVAESHQSLIPDNEKVQSSNSGTQSQGTPAPLVARAAEPLATPPPPTVIAQNTPPPAQPQREETRSSDSTAASSNTPNDNSGETLPQTASPLYLIGAAGLVSLAFALFLGLIKRQPSV
jgi:hypothetical protein